MDCNEARPLLDAATDRELSAAEALRLEQHVATCASCRREAQALQAVSQATRVAPYFNAPDALRARLVAALPAVDATDEQEGHASAASDSQPAPVSPRPPSVEPPRPETVPERPPERAFDSIGKVGKFGKFWPGWRTPRGAPTGGGGPAALGRPVAIVGAALAALAVTASLFLLVPRPPAPGSSLVDDLVASHVRAQLSGHDIDVVSSDQHTVKPWFNGRLDYAPPVEDLAASGFALTGGRLDYVDHRRVAVLVYRYRKHVIDVYVMPEQGDGAAPAPSASTSDGYALASWRAGGMIWWAVSDAEPAVLAQLHAALTERLQRPSAERAQ
ncbi:zf-HC2 domain-containing protein [Trinickia sp. Y13]|uniref:anti-sigma factor family protein n=1 Tax=Trinickia sp. Y13 TaxID=2917807 RepID=UPI0024055359|nr:zf-HC2 domain-containing protein [Trinickia sp. Y13]MDG0026297.1 zf-HC2 domain-containing protein [Trinickia sp. Y13]